MDDATSKSRSNSRPSASGARCAGSVAGPAPTEARKPLTHICVSRARFFCIARSAAGLTQPRPEIVEGEAGEGIDRHDARPVAALAQAPEQAGGMADENVAVLQGRNGRRAEKAEIDP